MLDMGFEPQIRKIVGQVREGERIKCWAVGFSGREGSLLS
jgi:hypothetical protein